MIKQCIISFMGPVGVGKSTQIKLLKGYCFLNKTKVVTTFLKSTHLLAYLMLKLVRLLRGNVNERLLSILCLLDAISISFKFFFSVYVPFRLGFTILMEEGPIMTLFTYTMRYSKLSGIKSKNPPFIRHLVGWILKQNHINVVLEAEENKLIARRKNRKYRQYESPDYVYLQRKWLNEKCFGTTIFIETTNLSPIQTHRVIVAAIEKACATF